jgi:O-antigen/teichoic acid export membrane protein
VTWYARLEAAVGIALLAVLAIISSLTFLVTGIGPVEPITTPLVAAIWRVSYGLSGAAVLVGILKGRGDLEAAGLVWLSGAVVINAIALILRPPEVAVVTASVAAFVAVVLTCAIRIRKLGKGRQTIEIEEP